MIKRELYLKKLRDFYNSNLIKVIYGVRRSGKSEILKQIKDELVQNKIPDHHILYLNFEDLNNFNYLDAVSLNKYIESLLIDQEMYYLLFDEIQMVTDFERVINSLKATKIVVSSSQAPMRLFFLENLSLYYREDMSPLR